MMPTTFEEILTLVTAYLIGSIPFGLFFSWLFKLPDPRLTGSHSTGATNILRSGNKVAAALTLFLDMAKGSFAVIFALTFSPQFAQLCGLCAIIGHIWPFWLGFRGGKGVATALGVILILSPQLAFICFVSWLVIAITSRYSSLASMITVVLSPLYTAFLTGWDFVLLCVGFAILIVWTHRENMARLLTGREPKIGKSNSSNSS